MPGLPSPPRWQAAVAFALTGEVLDLPESGEPQPAELVSALAERGWNQATVIAEARRCAASGEPWPHPVDPHLRAGLGLAQLQAALTATRHLLGVQTLVTRPPSARTDLTADEERLLRDVPPHHGA